ncbi:unnamed protein product [Jaminaea pallidilutea]
MVFGLALPWFVPLQQTKAEATKIKEEIWAKERAKHERRHPERMPGLSNQAPAPASKQERPGMPTTANQSESTLINGPAR